MTHSNLGTPFKTDLHLPTPKRSPAAGALAQHSDNFDMAGTSASARFFSPYGVAVSPDGKTVYVGEAYKNRIRAVSVEDGVITTLAGSGNRGFLDGDAGTARFSWPYGRAGHH